MHDPQSLDSSFQGQAIKDKSRSFSIGAYAASLLTIVTLLGLLMTLAGYGIALSVETEFGVPHATIFKSSFDLITLSVWFIAWEFSNLQNLLTEIFFSWEFWKWVLKVVGLTLIYCLLKFSGPALLRYLAKTSFMRNLPDFETKDLKEQFWLTIFVLVWNGIFASLVVPLLVLGSIFALSLMSIVSITSLSAGQEHIRKYVIEPTRCRSAATREQRLSMPPKMEDEKKEVVADCVRIVDGEKTIASGRSVFSTTEIIVLYDPQSGKVTRESLTGRSVEVISQL